LIVVVGLDTVLKTIDTALDMGFGEEGGGKTLKINSVVMKGINDNEINDFVEMTRHKPIEVRFIEYMPFDVPFTLSPSGLFILC
jgi:cyclic pyranopterin phosphate synthase